MTERQTREKAGWTPGPWRVLEPEDTYPDELVVDAETSRFPVAEISVGGISREWRLEAGANARLVALAPDLIDLARRVYRDPHDDHSERARVLIAKAEGRG